MTDKLIIFDTTLRDGEQSPGASHEQRREAADRPPARAPGRRRHRGRLPRQLARRLRGRAGHRHARSRTPTICALARANDSDIVARGRGAQAGASARASTPSSPPRRLHLEKKLRMTPEQVIEQARLSVRFARNLCDDVEFSPEDAYRSRRRLPLPGGRGGDRGRRDHGEHPRHRRLRRARAVRRTSSATCASTCPTPTRRSGRVHCHNDLGMAVANSLAGVRSAARGRSSARSTAWASAPATLARGGRDGASRRAATTSAWTCASTPRRSAGQPHGQPDHRLRGAAEQGGRRRQRLRPRAGIHQDGVLKARDTYEIMRAEDVGWIGQQDRAGQALRPQRLQAAPAGAGRAAGQRGRRSTPPSPSSRNWPTARARSSTRTSSRW